MCVGFILRTILAPIIINEFYKLDKGYVTLWGASEMLVYISTIISAAATVYVSWIAITQNKKANEISDRLLKLEEINSVPSLSILEEKTVFIEYSKQTVHFKVFVKNIINGIVDIKSVSNINFHLILSDITETLKFSNTGLNFPTLLPGQEKQLNFSINAHTETIKFCEPEFIRKAKCELVFNETFEIVLGYKDSMYTYKETVSLTGYVNFTPSCKLQIDEQKITRSDYRLERYDDN